MKYRAEGGLSLRRKRSAAKVGRRVRGAIPRRCQGYVTVPVLQCHYDKPQLSYFAYLCGFEKPA